MRVVISIVAAITCAATAASADESTGPVSARGVHWGVGAGGTLALAGGDGGRTASLLSAELYPGGRFGRLGFRGEALGLGQIAPNAALGGIIFEAAASRPRLQLALIGTAGLTGDALPLLRSAVQTQLWVLGPIAISGDGGLLLVIDGSDTSLQITTGLSLRLAD